jgi:hypothetical protein
MVARVLARKNLYVVFWRDGDQIECAIGVTGAEALHSAIRILSGLQFCNPTTS